MSTEEMFRADELDKKRGQGMRLNLAIKIECNQSVDEITHRLQTQEDVVSQQLVESPWLGWAGYHFSLDAKKREARIARRVLWDYSILKVFGTNDGTILEIKCAPRVSLYYVFFLLVILFFGMLVLELGAGYLLPCIAILAILLLRIVQLHKCFGLLESVAHKIVSGECSKEGGQALGD